MYRVTTPTHKFNLPFDTDTIDKFIITYQQDGQTIIEKTEADSGIVLSGKQITVNLTQQETALFTSKIGGQNRAYAQIRVKIDGKVLASNLMEIDVRDVLNEEVI